MSDSPIFNRRNPSWFADAAPVSNSEYSTFQTSYANSALCNGASNCVGMMTTGLTYSGATGDAAGNVDLLSVATHELGHALGLDPQYNNFTAYTSGYIPISDPLPFAGAHIFDFYQLGELNGSQGNLGNAAMQPYLSTGERLLISQADLLGVCQVSQLTDCVFDETPEPATSGLIFTAAIAVFAFRRRLAR